MIIIFEGRDNQGKSVLIDHLAHYIKSNYTQNVTVHKMDSHHSNNIDSFTENGLFWNQVDAPHWVYRYFLDMMRTQIESKSHFLILDRFHPTFFIYQKILFPNTIQPLAEPLEKAINESIAEVPHLYFHVDGGRGHNNDTWLVEHANKAELNLNETFMKLKIAYRNWSESIKETSNIIKLDTSHSMGKTVYVMIESFDMLMKQI